MISVYYFTFSFTMAAPDGAQQVTVVVVNGFSYSADNPDVDIEEFFTRYR